VKEGWTQEMVDEIIKESKELFEIAAKHEAICLPPWMDDNELRDHLIELYMVKEPALTEKEIIDKVEKTLKELKEFDEEIEKPDGKYMHTTARHYDLALTDPDLLREDLTMQYRRVYPDRNDEEIKRYVEEDVEALTIGAFKRLERKKKTVPTA